MNACKGQQGPTGPERERERERGGGRGKNGVVPDSSTSSPTYRFPTLLKHTSTRPLPRPSLLPETSSRRSSGLRSWSGSWRQLAGSWPL